MSPATADEAGSISEPSLSTRSANTDPAVPSREWVVRARSGDPAAQEVLFRTYVGMVDRLAFRLVPRGPDADDIVQDAFAAAFDRLPQLEDPAAFQGWLRQITVRTALRFLRTQRLRTRLGFESRAEYDIDQVVSASAPPDVRAELRAIYSRIDALPPRVRIVFILRKLEGLTIRETAAQLGVSEGTVKRRIRRAERDLGLRTTTKEQHG